jgi:hypothetical protein
VIPSGETGKTRLEREQLCARIGASKAEHLMACVDEFTNDR